MSSPSQVLSSCMGMFVGGLIAYVQRRAPYLANVPLILIILSKRFKSGIFASELYCFALCATSGYIGGSIGIALRMLTS